MDSDDHYITTMSKLIRLYNIDPDNICCQNCTSRKSDCILIRKDVLDYCQFCSGFTPDWKLIKAKKS